MDEISPAGVTRVWEIGGPGAGGRGPREWVLDPADFDLRVEDLGALKGGEPAENAERLERILAGRDDDPAGRAAVLLNAAAAIYISGTVNGFLHAVLEAKSSLGSSSARHTLDHLRGTPFRS